MRRDWGDGQCIPIHQKPNRFPLYVIKERNQVDVSSPISVNTTFVVISPFYRHSMLL